MSIQVERLQCKNIEIDSEGNLNIMADRIDTIPLNKELTEPKKSNILTINVKATEIDEVKNIIASFIFMLEDSRIDRDIRLQYLESCKELKEQYFVRIDK